MRIRSKRTARRRAGRPAESEREAHHAAILDAAMALFLERGFTRASMLEIARRAGASKTTLYALYPSKAELFAALIRRRSLAILQSVTTDAPSGEKPTFEALRDYGIRVVRSAQNPSSQRLHRLLVSEADKFPELAVAYWDNGPGLARRVLRDYFSAMDRQRRLRIDDVDLAIEHFLGALLGGLVARAGLLLASPIIDDAALENWVVGAVSLFLRTYGRDVGAGSAVGSAKKRR